MRPLDEDRTLDRYELVERIAVGGMAEVFRAKAFGAHGFEKVLAIKRILPELARDAEFEHRFIAEAKLAVKLTHANIVQVLDFGRFGGSLYIAMEFIDGPDLSALLKAQAERGQELPVAAALHIAMEMTKGLDFAHQRGVVHRDISPSNLLLSRAGEVKIADFGIAQAAVDSEKVLVMTGARRIMGKWRYMSPEQSRGETLDVRSDIFSAGAVIYELLTGRRLFPGDEIEEIVRNLNEMPIPMLSKTRPDLPRSLDDVLARALDRDRDKRYASTSELLRALLNVSYSQVLVATAFDVATVVSDAFPPAKPKEPEAERADAARLIDDIIRSELLAGPNGEEASRVTARAGAGDADPTMTGSAAFVRGTAGPDGITVWKLRTNVAVGPTAVTHAAPPETSPSGARAETTAPRDERPAAGWLTSRATRTVIVAVLAIVTGVAIVGRLRPSASQAPAVDATPVATTADLRIETTPAGATVVVDGAVWPERTPTTVRLPAADAGRPHALEVRLAGYRTWKDEHVIAALGERVVYRPVLTRAGARLRIESTPAGADADLDGRPLGQTPLALDEVDADGANHVVRLRKRGFLEVTAAVTLTPGGEASVERTLEPEVRYGRLDLYVEPWANVYLDGRLIGQAPAPALRLPVGRHRVKLVNPVRHKEKLVGVDVPATGVGHAKFVDWDK